MKGGENGCQSQMYQKREQGHKERHFSRVMEAGATLQRADSSS